MAAVTGDEVISLGCLGTLQKDIVVRVGRLGQMAGWFDDCDGGAKFGEQELAAPSVERIALALEQFFVFGQDGFRRAELDDSAQCQFRNEKRQTILVEVGRDDNVRIQDNPDRLAG